VGFEPTIAVFERAKTVHPSDRVAAVIGPKGTKIEFYKAMSASSSACEFWVMIISDEKKIQIRK
jgi:hypothetical protein